jgi:hypothetical protein
VQPKVDVGVLWAEVGAAARAGRAGDEMNELDELDELDEMKLLDELEGVGDGSLE